MTHICFSRLTFIGSDNGFSPGRRQAIIWTNAGMLLIRTLGTNFSEILIEIDTFSFKKMHLKKSSGKRRPFCLGLNMLINTMTTEGACSAPMSNGDGLLSMKVNFINSLAAGRPGCHFETAIFNLVLLIGIFTSAKDNALRWMPRDLTDDKSTLVQVMAWCRQATSHYLHHCWPRSLPPYGFTRPQWVNLWCFAANGWYSDFFK